MTDKISFPARVWSTLSAVDCSDQVQKKMNLSYLSWAWAWGILMKNYPESTYELPDPKDRNDGTVEVWTRVTVKDGSNELSRVMWLPVMDHKNNAIINPTTRHISDTRMRCLTKCLAMFGLGHYIYAGEDLPDPDATKGAEDARYDQCVKENLTSIEAIQEGIANDDLSSAAEAWFELDNEIKTLLWKAPKDGGVFTTREREVIKLKEFRESYYTDTKT